MTNCSDAWLRLEQVMGWAEMSANHFAYHIGLSCPDILYRIKAGRAGLSQNLARRIVEKFPQISYGWLLSGEGDMLGIESGEEFIPYYEGTIVEGLSLMQRGEMPAKYLHLPIGERCDCALGCDDDAMMPEVMPRSTIFLQATPVDAVVSGAMYVVACADFTLLRRVYVEGEDAERVFILEPSNETYDSVRVKSSQVEAVFKLLGALRLY